MRLEQLTTEFEKLGMIVVTENHPDECNGEDFLVLDCLKDTVHLGPIQVYPAGEQLYVTLRNGEVKELAIDNVVGVVELIKNGKLMPYDR